MSRERVIAFTDRQMLLAKQTGKFPTHREFVAHMFLKIHKCKVEDFDSLKYQYMESNGVNATSVTGVIGKALRLK